MAREREKCSVDIDSEIIRGWATKNKITIADISMLMGKSHGWLSYRLTTGYMRKEDVEQLAEITDLPVDDILGKTAVIEEAKRAIMSEEPKDNIVEVERIVEVEKFISDPLLQKLKRLVADKWVDGESSVSIGELFKLLNGED